MLIRPGPVKVKKLAVFMVVASIGRVESVQNVRGKKGVVTETIPPGG